MLESWTCEAGVKGWRVQVTALAGIRRLQVESGSRRVAPRQSFGILRCRLWKTTHPQTVSELSRAFKCRGRGNQQKQAGQLLSYWFSQRKRLSKGKGRSRIAAYRSLAYCSFYSRALSNQISKITVNFISRPAFAYTCRARWPGPRQGRYTVCYSYKGRRGGLLPAYCTTCHPRPFARAPPPPPRALAQTHRQNCVRAHRQTRILLRGKCKTNSASKLEAAQKQPILSCV